MIKPFPPFSTAGKGGAWQVFWQVEVSEPVSTMA
jgi:hypothetical protein